VPPEEIEAMSYPATRKTVLLIAAGALLLASCAQPTVHHWRTYNDNWQDFFAGAPGSEFLAVVWGNPFKGDKAETDAVVTETADKAFNRSGYHFSTKPKTVNPLAPYLAVLFNAPHSAVALPCGDLSALEPRPPSDGRVSIEAALCRGGTRLTAATGSVSGVRGPDDPRFRALVYQIAAKVFRPGVRSGQGRNFAASPDS
jgi:hypothetical protein